MGKIQSFLGGILAAAGAIFLEIAALILSAPLSTSEMDIETLASINFIFFLSILIEESLKFGILYKISQATENKKIVFNSFFLGLGFSLVEILLIYWNNSFDIKEISGIAVIHISTSLLMGYSIAKNIKKLPTFIFGFIPAMVVHIFYNVVKITDGFYQEKTIFGLMLFLLALDLFLLIKSTSVKNESGT